MPDTQGYKDRIHAGRELARQLRRRLGPGGQEDLLVLGLPRGGVPVAFEVAQALGAELDVLLVRKLGLPNQEEYAMGAIGSGGVRVLQPGVPGLMGVTQEQVEEVTRRELVELERRDRRYRGGRAAPRIAGRCVIVVDDGIATGATMMAALQVLRRQAPARLVVAAPVGAPDTVGLLENEADEVVCPLAPPRFQAVGQFYRTFGQTGDEEVQDLLAQAWAKPGAGREQQKGADMKPIPTETATDVGSVGKWLGAAAAGALLMYLLDPERGPARRSRAASALKSGAARTGSAVDHALHSAGESLGALTGSAADAISRGAGKLQAQAAPLLERARHAAHEAEDRITAEADHARERARREAQAERERYQAEHSYASRNRYDHDEHYAHGGGLAGMLQHLGDRLGAVFGASRGPDSALLGGSLLGLLGVMRRNPAGLLVGLAGLALLMRSGTQRYSVGSLALPKTRQAGEPAPYLPSGTEPGSRTLH